MTKQIINVGSADQAGDGESIRSAFTKINENFTELYNAIPGPYAGDTEAGLGGVNVGRPYYQPSGRVYVRLQ